MTLLLTYEPTSLTAPVSYDRLVQDFLSGRKQTTLDTYRKGLETFAEYLGAGSINEAARILLSKSHGEANATVLEYKNWLVGKHLSPNTINSRLSAIRSLVDLAQQLGMVSWSISIRGLKSENYRDTRGPGREKVQEMVGQLKKEDSKLSRRNLAILRLLFDLGLRRGSVANLDLADVDLENRAIYVRTKGTDGDHRRTLPNVTAETLRQWIEVRGNAPGPLFHPLDNHSKGLTRLSARSIHEIVAKTGELVGIDVWPHALRHSAITLALDLTNGNVRAVAKFSGHKDIRVIERYDDNRLDLAGEIACMVAGDC